MTKEQFNKAINDRQSRIKNLETEIKELKQTYVQEHASFEFGEKVVVTEKTWNDIEKKHVAYVTNIWVGSDGLINYSFHQAKKDGSMSSKKLHVWRYDIEKLNSGQGAQASVASKV